MKSIDLIPFILITLILTCIFIIIILQYKREKCPKGGLHDWYKKKYNTGSTGDLGFGIKGVWYSDITYECEKCGKTKFVDYE